MAKAKKKTPRRAPKSRLSTAQQAKLLGEKIQKEEQARIKVCGKAIQEVLKKFKCGIRAIPNLIGSQLSDGSMSATISAEVQVFTLNPKEEDDKKE